MYCLVPAELAGKLHEPLRRHFADADVQVVVEQRWRDRRRGGDRRCLESPTEHDRRRIQAEAGRRVADRRSPSIPVDPPTPLPRRARPFADRLQFVERLEPSTEQLEDRDTARLVRGFQAGDRALFEDLYLRYFDRVYGYLRVALEDHQEAEDVTQDVFFKAYDALPRYAARPGVPFRAWLFRIARNAAIDRTKRLGRLQVEEPETIGRRVEEQHQPQSDLDLDWISDADLLLLIERLPAPQRQVLTLRYALGLTTQEIAIVMDRSAESVAQLHSRARAFLEARLTAVRAKQGRASRRSPMLIRLRRMPVLGARRAPLVDRHRAGAPSGGRRR